MATTSITFSVNKGSTFADHNGVSYSYDSGLPNYTYTNSSITSIGSGAFTNDFDLTSVAIGNIVTSIGASAFNACISLATITFNSTSTLASIGANAFEGTAITSITIPDSTTTIGNNAFLIDTVLSSVTNYTGSVTTSYGTTMFGTDYNSNLNNFYSNSITNPMYNYVQTYYPNVNLHPASCFNEGTQILTKNGYVNIENIKVGDEIEIVDNSYKKVTHLLNQPFTCSNSLFNHMMCKYKCDNFPDLMITGGHSIMVDKLNDKMEEYVKKHNCFDCCKDGKYKMLAGLDDRCEKVVEGKFNVYHLVLENNGDLNSWNWIYSNGLVSESMSEKYYQEINGNNV